MPPGRLTSRGRFVLATAVVALPLVLLVVLSAVNRYSDDRERAETRAVNRAELYAALLAQNQDGPPGEDRLRELLELSPMPAGSALTVLSGDEVVARVGTAPELEAPEPGTAVSLTDSDGVTRVWGLAPVDDTGLTVAFGLPGDAVYGDARSALLRDLGLAALALVFMLIAAYVAGDRLTAPIRRLAAVAGARRQADEYRTIAEELERRADRIAALRAIDRGLLDAGTADEMARAALVPLRRIIGAGRAEVLLRDGGRERTLAVDGADGAGDHETLVPIEADGERLGTIRLCFPEAGDPDDDVLGAAREVAHQLAIALRHSRLNAEMAAILDGAMDAVVVFDSDRRFLSVNEAACRFYGRPREELIGSRLDDLIGTERAEQDWEDFLTEERIAQGMLEHVWDGEQNGERRVLEVRSLPEFLPGRHLFVVRDVTESRRLEDQLRQSQKMEAVGQLAGGVAHDFNNLLTVIGGYSDIARRRIGAGPGATELLEVQRAAERATQLTRQLLAFSRQQVLDPVSLDLGEVTSALIPMLRRLIGEDITVAVVTEPSLPTVLADRSQVEQVVINLAVNARDAMPTGGTLTIETRRATLDEHYAEDNPGVAAGDYVCLSVTDTGMGMSRETMAHVFEPFFTTKDVGQGTGLGLATVHGIVNQSGGHIQVYSELSLGTSLKVYLPVAALAEEPPPEEPVEAAPEDLTGSETVLLCEDEEGVRQLIETVLVLHGYRVLSCAGPSEALEWASEVSGSIDVLVTDVIMPDMTGPELAERVREIKPGLRTLFISGYTAETVRTRGGLPPGSAFLEKPFDQDSLLRAVVALLDRAAS